VERRSSTRRTRGLTGALVVGALLIVAAGVAIAGRGRLPVGAAQARSPTLPPPSTKTAVLKERFAGLSVRRSNECALGPQRIDSLAVIGRLQGSCCTPMVFDHYAQQVRGLAAYGRIPQIPPDPYDIPVRQAKRLLAYTGAITLTAAQQAIYHRGTKLSHERGPCCCHCWRWTTFEGQAKYLIARRGYTAAQIATVWDLENGCGGPAA